MTTAQNEYTTELAPATPEEVEWAFEVATTGYENDMIRRGIIAAADEDEALRFVRYHQNGGGCGPSGAPGDGPYWYDYESDGCHAWFGEQKGKPLEGTFVKGDRYVRLSWKQVIRRVRDEAAGPSLF